MSGEAFHLLRPAWLLALALLPLLIWIARRQQRSAGPWAQVCDAPLLQHLLVESGARTKRWPLGLFSLGWIAACLALAGPTWERLPQPSFQAPAQTAIVLSLSRSMGERDVVPSRIARARFELLDLVERMEGAAGLVIYAEEPYVVTPLTDDANVIAQLVPTLTLDLMPGRGSRLDRAIDEARTLLARTNAIGGRIIVIGDGLGDRPDAVLAAAERAHEDGFRLAVFGIGGDSTGLSNLARAGNGPFAELTADDRDVDHLLSALPESFGNLEETDVRTDVWRDMGVWLVLIPLFLAPLAFRRGWATSLLILAVFGLVPQDAEARELSGWWSRPDQQGARAFAQGDHGQAAALFEDAEWRAAAQYRAGDYSGAIESLADTQGTRASYNTGNALARAGQLEDAVTAYDQLLEFDPEHADAIHNRDLVKQLLQQQQQQQQQQQDPSSQGSENEQSADDSREGEGSGESESSHESESEAETGSADSDGSEQSGSGGTQEIGENAETESGTETGASDGQASEEHAQQPTPSDKPDSGSPDASGAGTASGSEDPARDDREEPRNSGAPGEFEAREPDPDHRPDGPNTPAHSNRVELSEAEQAIEQWLNRIPDDPGGLLREKLRRRYAEKRYRASFGGQR